MEDEVKFNAPMIWRNQKGEIIIELKRKQFGDETYFLFRIHRANMEPDKLEAFDNLVWPLLKRFARRAGFGLFDIEEISKAVNEQVKERELKPGASFDIQIPVLNHATGEITMLTLGLTSAEPHGKPHGVV